MIKRKNRKATKKKKKKTKVTKLQKTKQSYRKRKNQRIYGQRTVKEPPLILFLR